jgi:GNAT superfamily N-acetyltransferase
MTVVIRRASAADAGGIAVLHVATWQAAYDGLLDGDYLAGLSVTRREAQWREIFAAGTSQTVVAQAGKDLVGFASIGPSRDDGSPAGCGELYAIYVHPSWWDHGLGHRLHDGALAMLGSSGHTDAVLWVLEGNARARRFYERQGWRLDGAIRTEQIGAADVAEVRYHLVRLRSSPL